MNPKSAKISHTLKEIFLGLLVVLLMGTATDAQAALRILNFPILFQPENGQGVSGNGSVVIGTTPDGQAGYWTATSALTPIPRPKNGISWDSVLHLNFDGSVIAGCGGDLDPSRLSAWTWRKGVGLKEVFSTNSSTAMKNLGVSSDGSFVVRSVTTSSGNQITIHRDYSNGQSYIWTEINNAKVSGLSEDCSTLYGQVIYPGSTTTIPCYWPASGVINYGTEFLSSAFTFEPRWCSKNGQIIVGLAHTGIDIGDPASDVTLAFRWNTVTHQINFYYPAGYLTTSTDYVSPQGDLMNVGGLLSPSQAQGGVIDVSTAAESAKGIQNTGAWLVAHLFMKAADIKNRGFSIYSMSDDETVAVGVFFDSTDNLEHSFIANRLVAVPASSSVISK